MSAKRKDSVPIGLFLVVALTWQTYAQTPGIVYDSQTGTYDIYYYSLDTLRHGLYIPGNVGDPSVTATVTPSGGGSFDYEYILYNGANASRALSALTVGTRSNVSDFWAPDSNWYARQIDGGFYWSQVGPDSLDIDPGDSLSGFGFESFGLPTIVTGSANNYSVVEFESEDEDLGPGLETKLDSLVAYTGFTWVVMIAPRDPPTPFDLGDFLDTLGTYPLRAAAQGWIGDSTAAELDRLLNDASSALDGGDSTWTATLLCTVLNYVEAVKDDSLSSEGYALMKYNIEHTLGYLPPLIPVKVLLHGPFVSGVMSPNNTDTPILQPFCDPSLPFNIRLPAGGQNRRLRRLIVGFGGCPVPSYHSNHYHMYFYPEDYPGECEQAE